MIADHCDVSQTMSLDEVMAAQGWLGGTWAGSAGWSDVSDGWLLVGSRTASGRQRHGTHRQRRTTTVSLLAGMKPSMKTFLLPQL